jgi:hypothetical protein
MFIMKKFEKINHCKIPNKLLNKFEVSELSMDRWIFITFHNLSIFKTSCKKIQIEEETSTVTYSILDLFKTPRLRRTTLFLIVIWMLISLVFDGHVRNVGALGLNVFLTFTIASFTEFPADTFLTFVLDRY